MSNKPNQSSQWPEWMDRSELKRLALLLVLFAVFAVGLWLPAYSERSELRQRIETARDELSMDLNTDSNTDLNMADADHLPTLHKRVTQLKQRLDGAQSYVPREDEQDGMLRALTKAIQSHNVSGPSVVRHKPETYAGYTLVPMTIEFEGSFPAAFGVLHRIETMPRLVRIDELEMEPVDDTLGGRLMVTLHLSTFFAQGEGAQQAAQKQKQEQEETET